MKKLNLFLLILALMGLSVSACAQVTTGQGTASDATNKKIHRLDLLIKLVPLALQKNQYAQLLAGLDKARSIQKDEQTREDAALADLDPKVSEAVDNAVQKGIYPPRDLQEDIAKKLNQMSIQQIKVGAAMIKAVYDSIQADLNAGQRKAMAGSYTAAYIDARMKPEDLTEDIRLRFYVRMVLLDPATYDLLTEMSKNAS